jgi:hypothetical protein
MIEKKNQEGYPDPTPYEAIKNADAEVARISWLMKTLHSVCNLAGFQIEGRIVLKDLRTGRVWR